MSRIALIVAAAAALLLAGCATNYEHYAKAIEAQAKYQAVAETERASAFKAALESADPVARAVAANGLGITEALRVTGRGGGNGVTPIAPPKTMLEEAATLISAFNPWVAASAQIYGIKKNADVAIAAQQAAVESQRIQSGERVSIFNRFGQTADTLGGKPSIVINGDGNGVNGSDVDNSHNVNNCPQNVTGNAGGGGNGGNAGAGGNGATGGSGGAAGANGGAGGTGAPGAPGGTAGNGGGVTQTPGSNCRAGRA